MRFLSISPVIPEMDAKHAGGKTYSYYLTGLYHTMRENVSVLCFGSKSEWGKSHVSIDKNCCNIVYTRGEPRAFLLHALCDAFSIKRWLLPNYSKYKNREAIRYLKKLKNKECLPNIIELEWTGCVFFAPSIKKKFPEVRIIASEHDVSFLGAERKFRKANGINKFWKYIQFRYIKKTELKALDYCDCIIPQNKKDKDLLIKYEISEKRIHVLTPFYHNMSYIERKNINHDILFWGAMSRPENYEAAIWFIDNVMPLLKYTDVRFIIAGNNPPKCLLQKQSDKVIVTGFVEDETSLFLSSLCFVSPLLTGAGIKVKIIEAMSAGIPVLTNDIGIEGIPAKNEEEYFQCVTAQDYVRIIEKLISGDINTSKLRSRQLFLIKTQFNLAGSLDAYRKLITRLSNQ